MIDPEIEQRLSVLEQKIAQNTLVLDKINKRQKRARTIKYAYWAFLIGLSIVSLTLIKPYISQLEGVYNFGGNSDLNSLLNN